MRANLKDYKAESFSITLKSDLENLRPDLVRQIAGDELSEDQHVVLAATHRQSGELRTDIGVLRTEAGTFEFSTSYGLADVPKPPAGVGKLEAAVRTLSQARLEFDVTVHATFNYEKGVDKSAITLPIRVFRPHPAAMFDTIEGIEVVRTPQGRGEPRYVNYITVVPEEQDLLHFVHIEVRRGIGQGFEKDFLKMATDFSRQFLVSAERGG